MYQIRNFVKHQTKQLTCHRIARALKPFAREKKKKKSKTHFIAMRTTTTTTILLCIRCCFFAVHSSKMDSIERAKLKETREKRAWQQIHQSNEQKKNRHTNPAAKNKLLLNDFTKLEQKKKKANDKMKHSITYYTHLARLLRFFLLWSSRSFGILLRFLTNCPKRCCQFNFKSQFLSFECAWFVRHAFNMIPFGMSLIRLLLHALFVSTSNTC